MPVNTVVFDLDGTLVDTAPDLTAATNAILTAHGRRPVSLGEVREMVGQGARKLIVRGFEATGEALDEARLEPLYQNFIDHYVANIAVNSAPYPGALELLERCHAAGLGMAVCTNKLEALSVRLIDELNLSHYFSAIIGPDTIGIGKPDPAPYHEAVARAGGSTPTSVMIGDSATDIATAKAAGAPVIAVSFGYTDTHVSAFEPDHVVDHFDEVWDLLEKMF